MVKRTKVILIVLVGVVVIGGGLLAARGGKQSLTEYTTVAVVRQDLQQTVSATGALKTAEDIDLNFAAAGRIVALPAKVGQAVTAGALLAQLDSSDLQVQLQQTNASLASARANLEKVLGGATNQEVDVASAQVKSADAAYQAALVDVAAAKQNETENMGIFQDTAVADLQNYLFKAHAALDAVVNTYNDQAGQNYISARNPQDLLDTKDGHLRSTTALVTSDALAAQAASSRSYTAITTSLDDAVATLNLVAATLDDMFSALSNSVTSTTFTETSLESLKTRIRTEQTTIATGIATLQTDKSNLATKRLYYANAVTAAEQAASVKKEALELTKAQYRVTTAPARSTDVDYQRALVAQAESQVAAVRQRMADRVIAAPVAGVVTKVNFAVGEYANLATPVVSMLGTQTFDIEVDVPESDIAKVSVGNQAAITIDAFGDSVPFSGTVTLIEPAATEISGVVYYKVTVSLNETDKPVKSGMTANVDIMTDQRSQVLVMPQRAVTEKNSVKSVQVLTNPKLSTVEERTVTTGLRGDGGLVEVLSGVSEGEAVVTFVKENGKK